MFGRRDPYRRQIRRMRRAWRKGENAYPILILGNGEPFLFYLLRVAALWCYRHRSAFAPFRVTALAFIAALVLHGPYGVWGMPVTTITAVTVTVLGFPHTVLRRYRSGQFISDALARLWEEFGIDRGIERAYAATVIAATGGWLSAAIVLGPITMPLPVIAGISCVLLGIPWWFHRRRREKVRVERIIDGWPQVAEHIGLAGSEIVSVVVDTWGWTARVTLRKGTTTDQATARIHAIESGLGLRPGSVRVFPDGTRADRFTMRVVEKDPRSGPIPWPGTSAVSITTPIEVGISEDGQPVRILILRRNVLIGGTTGSGKSGVLNIIIATLAACADVVLWGIDLKGGMELQPWADCFEKLATTPEEADELFRQAVAKLDERAARMAAEGKRVWDPTPDDPALVIITDEHAELPDQSHVRADSIARRGRAVAVNLIAATQRPTQAAMGKNTSVRSQMDVRICLRVRERRDVDLILGQGAFHSGWHAHMLTQPGEFLVWDPEHTTPERHRAFLLTDEPIARHAAACALTRPRLPAGSPDTTHTAPESPQTGPETPANDDGPPGPETALWAALVEAGPDGATVGELIAGCGMSRSWVYYRLREHAQAGRAAQTGRGTWRVAGPGPGRPPARPRSPRPPGRPPRRGQWPRHGDGS
jgi:DNA segregation ATPase FtsK/SpoIIIE, S-DNA-T family